MNKGRIMFRVRYRESGGKVRSKLVLTGSHRSASKVSNGKVLEIRKVSSSSLDGVGEYNQMPERLMREFRQTNGNNRVKEVECYG